MLRIIKHSEFNKLDTEDDAGIAIVYNVIPVVPAAEQGHLERGEEREVLA